MHSPNGLHSNTTLSISSQLSVVHVLYEAGQS